MVGIIMIVLNVLYVCRVSVFLEPSEECVRYSRNTSTPDVPTHTYTKYIACQGVGHVTIWFSASCWSFPYIQERKVVLLAQNSWPHDTSWHRLVVWFPISRWVSAIYCENINSKNVIPVFISHGCDLQEENMATLEQRFFVQKNQNAVPYRRYLSIVYVYVSKSVTNVNR